MSTVLPLTDDHLREWGEIGAIDLRFAGRWDRIEAVLEGLDHDPVQYRWTFGSEGEQALYVEIPVSGDVDIPRVLRLEQAVKDAIYDLNSEYLVQVRFVDRDWEVREDE